MVLSAKWSKISTDGWGMGGFLLIFFPEDDSSSKKKTLLSLTSPSTSPSSSSSTAIKSPSGSRLSTSGKIISRTQSTLSICGLLVFTTFLLFTLSTFDPTTAASAHRHRTPRRFLLLTDHPPPSRRPAFPLATRIVKFFNSGKPRHGAVNHSHSNGPVKALQGMGVLYRRGTRAMADLHVAHVSDAVDERQFRAFLRILHTNGLLARSDLVFIFSSSSVSSKFSPLIREENESLLKLVLSFDRLNRSNHESRGLAGLTRYVRTKREEKKEAKEAIWAKGFRATNYSDVGDLTRPSYGSMVGFDASELDPVNSLSGFLDHVPMGLRRWACYPMLLGRIRRSYKHMALVDVESVLVLNDPFTRVRNRRPDSVYLWAHPDSESSRRGNRQSAKGHQETTVNPGIVVGGSRGVRRLSDAVLTEIVRAVIEPHKGKAGRNPVTESGIVNKLVRAEHLLKNVNVIGPAEAVTDVGEVFGSGSNSGSVYSNTVVQWGHGSNKNNSVIMRDVWCWSDLHSVVYRDCLVTQK